mgnify:CR=1 FL=1
MVIALTGAGISSASGIPTFAEQPSIRNQLERQYATQHPHEYRQVIEAMKMACDVAVPNDAHLALAEYAVPVITMNVDGLHQRAGSEHVLAIHGTLPDIVLYGDPAPRYQDAFAWGDRLREGDIFLIIGTSFFTTISTQLKMSAMERGALIREINADAEHRVRAFLETLYGCNFDEFMARECEF